ncbi:MAG TPA: DUF3597 domain-containing protein [Sulfurovum sp.]|nr:DUF3597 domain-containing protein [Sulfurovum sp.]
MGIFDSIMSKLGFGDDEKDKAAGQVNVANAVDAAMSTDGEVSQEVQAEAEAAVEQIAAVDVAAQMDALSSASKEDLNWKVSIVDLMKLLGLDSSYGHRKDLARELECPADMMGDSAKMNVWLHKTVMTKLAQNGGNVPADLMA